MKNIAQLKRELHAARAQRTLLLATNPEHLQVQQLETRMRLLRKQLHTRNVCVVLAGEVAANL